MSRGAGTPLATSCRAFGALVTFEPVDLGLEPALLLSELLDRRRHIARGLRAPASHPACHEPHTEAHSNWTREEGEYYQGVVHGRSFRLRFLLRRIVVSLESPHTFPAGRC